MAVNQVILDYLKGMVPYYPLDYVKEKILSYGFSESDFYQALDILKGDKTIMFYKEPSLDMQTESESSSYQEERLYERKLRFFGLIGFFTCFLVFLLFSISFFKFKFKFYLSATLFFLIFFFVFFLLFGFFRLGSYLNYKSLKYSSLVVFLVLILFVLLFSFIYFYDFQKVKGFYSGISVYGSVSNLREVSITEAKISLFSNLSVISKIVLVLALSCFFVFVVSLSFFSGCLILVSEKARFSFFAGIFGILLSTILFGLLSYFIYLIFNPHQIFYLIVSSPSLLFKSLSYIIVFVFFLKILFDSLTLFFVEVPK